MLLYIDNSSVQSIAIPAISTGIYGFPKRLCADTILEAINKF
jgi:O-acetyl-ADP-ribose deacetylase (regulator of RNase III)